MKTLMGHWSRVAAACLIYSRIAGVAPAADEPFRPETGKFPPAEMAKAYQGQLAFVDHANRRGSLRFTGGELLHSTAPRPFAMLPCGTPEARFPSPDIFPNY
jgi:hypothetical protein